MYDDSVDGNVMWSKKAFIFFKARILKNKSTLQATAIKIQQHV